MAAALGIIIAYALSGAGLVPPPGGAAPEAAPVPGAAPGVGAGAVPDLVFIDPPFADGLWEAVIAGLPSHLAADAWLYVESPADQAPKMPAPWLLHREGGTREVRFALYRRATATLSPDQHA